MPATDDELRELDRLISRARALYDGLRSLPADELEHRRAVWAEILEVQARITELLGVN
jgi:hypothetical protein